MRVSYRNFKNGIELNVNMEAEAFIDLFKFLFASKILSFHFIKVFSFLIDWDRKKESLFA